MGNMSSKDNDKSNISVDIDDDINGNIDNDNDNYNDDDNDNGSSNEDTFTQKTPKHHSLSDEEDEGNVYSRQTIKDISEEFMNIETDKKLNEHLQDKLEKLNTRLKKLQLKYYSYKTWYDRLNIMIIAISSLLSIIEALRNELIHITEDNKTWTVLFNIIPLGISTFITGTAAVIQFQKYQEKMENMRFTKEKVILAISKIKHIQESIWFCKEDEFESLKKKYMNDIYSFYNESSSELERQLKSV